jgi:tetratricopeptide (TPR) repeat protein
VSAARLENLRRQASDSATRGDALRLLLFLAVPMLGLALTVDYLSAARYFHGDEAVYYAMADSLAHDADIRYERKDLLRIFEQFNQGPQGIVLKGVHGADGEERVYYAKPFLYSALVAPLVRVLETNGAFVAGVLLWLASVVLAASSLRRSAFPWPLLTATILVGASVGTLYTFWIQPELMNFALVLLAYWLWRVRSAPIAALMLLGAVTFSKIPTGVLAAPILGTLLLRRRFALVFFGGLAFVATAALLFGLNLWATGEWNYQSGERSIFYFARRFPYQQAGGDPFFRLARPAAEDESAETPDPAGSSVAADGPATKARGSGWSFKEAWKIYKIEPSMLWRNLASFWVGRYSGHLLYWPLLCLLLIPSLFVRPWKLEDGLTWLGTAGATIAFLMLAQDNYFGGSGTVGNRYFSMMLPPLVFTLRRPPLWYLRATLAVAVLLAGQLILDPFMSLFNAGDHATREPFHSFPIELSLINSVSIPNRNFVKLPFDQGRVLAYLPDAGTYGWEDPGFFWTRGDDEADVVLRIPFEPLRRVLLLLDAGAARVQLDVSGAAAASSLRIPAGGHLAVPLTFDDHYLHSSFYGGKSYLYPLHLKTRGGFVPTAVGMPDARYLGVRVRFTAAPAPLAEALVERGRFAEAADAAEAATMTSARLARVRGVAALGAGRPDEALNWGEQALALGADPGDLLPQMCLAALEAGRFLQARALALRLASLRPHWWWPRFVAAQAALRSGSESVARVHLQEAERLDPNALEPRLLRLRLSGRPTDPRLVAGTTQACVADLGGVLQVEAAGMSWEADSLHGTLLARARRRPSEPLDLFVHLVSASSAPRTLLEALWSDLWSGLRDGRTSVAVPLADASVPTELWTNDEPVVLTFHLEAPADLKASPYVWLGIGLLSETDLKRLPVSSPDLWVLRSRALVSLTAGVRATRTDVSGASGLKSGAP